MKKFDGILIASDWDGTLFCNGDISAQNKAAIEYFMENGGYFTVCSGRYYSYLKAQRDKIAPNTYSICLNGAYIANTENGDILYSKPCDERLFEYIDILFLNTDNYETVYLYPADADGSIVYTKDEYTQNLSEIKQRKYYKAAFYSKTNEGGDRGAKHANSIDLGAYSAQRSYRPCLEIMLTENTKGEAIKKLANHLGVKFTVAVGDYENDIPMLIDADVGYAVENAADSVKAIADRITVSCENSALAKIIQDIEFDILPKIKS